MAIITGTNGDDNPTLERHQPRRPDVRPRRQRRALVGFDGDDLLEGGAGADELWGGYGFDYASYKGSPAGVLVNLQDSLRHGRRTPPATTSTASRA